MSKGPAVLPLLLAVLVAANACGATRSPAARTDVQRGTALPPPGLDAPGTAARR